MRLRYVLGVLLAAATFCGRAAIPASELAVAVEFYHAALDHYFITAEPAEIADLDSGVHTGWTRTGYRFSVIKRGSSYPGTMPMCRFWSGMLSSHFYTAKPSECEDVKVMFAHAWQFESGEVFRAFLVDAVTGQCPADTTPVYRLYNNRPDVNHRYTDQLSAFVFMKGKGYIPEGDGNPAIPIAFCTPSGGDAFRLRCPRRPCARSPRAAPRPRSGRCSRSAPTAATIPRASCGRAARARRARACDPVDGGYRELHALRGQRARSGGSRDARRQLAAKQSATAAPPPGGDTPPQCGLSATPLFPAVGTSASLSATCSQSPTSYQWIECAPNNPSNCSLSTSCSTTSATCMVSASIPGNTRYIVSGINSAGTGPWVPVDIEWQDNPASRPGFCGQYQRVKHFTIPWGSLPRYDTAEYGGFTPETVFVMAMTVPATPSTYGTAGYTSLAEYRGPPTLRHMTLSNTQCDFRTPDPAGVNGPFAANSGTAVLVNWNVGAAPVALTPGQTYYFNFRNLGCGQSSCEASTTTNWPH